MLRTWATEGHSIPLPGMGTMRFGVRSKAVEKLEDVKTNLYCFSYPNGSRSYIVYGILIPTLSRVEFTIMKKLEKKEFTK